MRKILLISAVMLGVFTTMGGNLPQIDASTSCVRVSNWIKKHSCVTNPSPEDGLDNGRLTSRIGSNSPQIWRAAGEDIFVWENGWEFNEHYDNVYDSRGLLLCETILGEDPNDLSRTEYVYNEHGNFTLRQTSVSDDGGKTWVITGKTLREYDARLVNVIVSNEEYQLIGGQLVKAGNNYRRIITRNADGNITGVEIAVLYQGAYDPTQRLTVHYGPDRRADEVYEEVLNSSLAWEPATKYTGITWLRTDGQIWSTDMLTTPDNAMQSCSIIDGEMADMPLACTVTYPDEMGSYLMKLTASVQSEEGEIRMENVAEMTIPDSYGSYDLDVRTNITFMGMTMEANQYIEQDHYDAYGLETLYHVEETEEGETKVMADMKGQVEYDLAYGYPLDYSVIDYDPETKKRTPLIRVEFKDYKDVTAGVDRIAHYSDNENTKANWYDLSGKQLKEEPKKKGIYIRKSKAKTTLLAK